MFQRIFGLFMTHGTAPNVFESGTKSEKTLKRWEKEAGHDPIDSVWDMVGPLKYSLNE